MFWCERFFSLLVSSQFVLQVHDLNFGLFHIYVDKMFRRVFVLKMDVNIREYSFDFANVRPVTKIGATTYFIQNFFF